MRGSPRTRYLHRQSRCRGGPDTNPSYTRSPPLGSRTMVTRRRRAMHPTAFVPHCLPLRPLGAERASLAMNAAPGLSAGDQVSRADWRSFRARLVRAEEAVADESRATAGKGARSSEWAHRLAHVEVGCVLVSQDGYEWPDSFAHLNRAVLLITAVSRRAVAGLLLTRPTNLFVGDQASVVGRVGKEFKENILHLGGDTSMGTLEVLHAHDPVVIPGARELIPGISVGGFNAARRLVQSGEASATDFHFFVAYARWVPAQLAAELAAGAWTVAACAPSVLMEADFENPALDRDALWRRLHDLLGNSPPK